MADAGGRRQGQSDGFGVCVAFMRASFEDECRLTERSTSHKVFDSSCGLTKETCYRIL